MNLLNVQKKFILSKPREYTLIKGKTNTGKSEAMLHRVLNLVNNFSYEDGDKILFVEKNKKSRDKAIEQYKAIKNKSKYDYMSLLCSKEEPLFLCFEELVDRIVKENKVPSLQEKINILKDVINKNTYKSCKKINIHNVYVLLSEIKYMKNNNIVTLDDFMTLMGGPLTLRKNSKSREDIFNLYREYNNALIENDFIDEEDRVLKAMNSIFNEDNGFVHIFIDNGEEFSKLELEFLLSLHKRKEYATLTVSVNTDKGENLYSSLVKKGRVYGKKVFGMNKKIFNFKTDILSKNKEIKIHEKIVDDYTFIDFKHRREFKFLVENEGDREKLITEEKQCFKEEELQVVPVFNNIAAGEPILISPEQEDIFMLPKYWIKGSGDKFILKVKGDSMIEANIHNGDLVVIEQTSTPNNGDIVAVNINGSATLKTLKVGIDEIILMPANIKYEPIHVSKEEEFYILGKAVGIIRK